MKQFRNPETVHAPLAEYTHQVEISEAQRWLVLSGQIGMKKDGTLPSDPIQQFKIALDNIEKNLRAANMDIPNVVKLTIYLVGEINTEARRGALQEWLGDHSPCSTLIYVAALASPTFKVEIDAWACT